jgi:hypothetical protein
MASNLHIPNIRQHSTTHLKCHSPFTPYHIHPFLSTSAASVHEYLASKNKQERERKKGHISPLPPLSSQGCRWRRMRMRTREGRVLVDWRIGTWHLRLWGLLSLL